MFSQDFYDGVLSTPEHIVTDRKFSIALRSGDVSYTQKKLGTPGPLGMNEVNLNILLENASRKDIAEAETRPTMWPVLLKDILTDTIGRCHGRVKENDNTIRVWELTRRNLYIQQSYNASCDRTLGAPRKNEGFHSWLIKSTSHCPIISSAVRCVKEIEMAVESQGQLKYKLRNKKDRSDPANLALKCKWGVKDLNLYMCWNDKVVFINYKGHKWLLPGPYLLQIHNKLCDLISCLVLIRSSAGVCYEENAPSLVVEFLVEMCNRCINYPDSYFDIAKTLEGAIIAEIIKREEKYKNDELLRSVANDLDDIDFDYLGSDIRSILLSSSTPLMHEIGGLVKLPGHPIIDLEKTTKKFLEKVRAPSIVCNQHLQLAANSAKEAFIRNYILKHKHWPPVVLDQFAPEALHKALERGVDPASIDIVRRYGKIDTQHYVYIELEKCLEFDKVHHYAQHLKDKTIALVRTKAFQKYVERTRMRHDWKETRLLMFYLTSTEDHDALQDYLKEYMNSDDDLEDVLNYLCIKLVPKEKELKEAARLFGCKTYHDRFRSKVQEENAAHFMDNYMIDQSMTLDNLGLIKRLYAFRVQNKAYKGWRALWVNFDVSSWAERWRTENTAPILSQTLDKVFDTNIFSKTHRSYEKGFFYIPDAEGGAYHWEGQSGGVQGLNQYTWMNCYVPMMRSLLQRFGMHFYVMAYGDDYKACFLIPPDQSAIDMTVFKQEVTRIVADSATIGFGHVMKAFDSYGSECYVSFCKKASVRAIELPQGFRKALKCHGSTNAFLPTLDEYVSGAYSNAHGAAKEMPVTYAPYSVALFWTFLHLLEHKTYKNLSTNKLLALSLTPSVVGGLPIIYLHNYHTRAESDYLAPFLDLLHHMLRDGEEDVAAEMSKFLAYDRIQGAECIETLLRDPYALPIAKPPLPSAILRKCFSKAIRPLIKNEEVLELMDAAEEEWSRNFTRCLTSSDVLQPRLLSAIYSCTPKALLEEFLRRFENSSSIKEVLVMRSGERNTRRILRRTMNADLTLQKWRVDVFSTRMPCLSRFNDAGLEPWCPSREADHMRKQWGKPVIGVSMPPSQHQILVIEETRGALTHHGIHNHFRYVSSEPQESLKNRTSDHWSLGPHEPFHGHKTRLNMEIPSIRISEHNPQLLKLQTLLDILSWTNIKRRLPDGTFEESNLPDLIMLLIRQYYKGDVEELTPFAGKTKGGTIGHHMRSPHYKEFIMPNTLYNYLTRWRSETNCHRFFSGSPGSHFSINFLLLRCFCVHLLTREMETGTTIDSGAPYWGVTTPCSYCRRLVEDPPIRVDMTKAPGSCRILQMTKLDDHSQMVIRDSLLEFSKENIMKVDRGDVPVPILFACQTVMDYSINREHHASRTLKDRFMGGVTMSEEARSVLNNFVSNPQMALVRLSELKKLPVNVIIECLAGAVYDFIRRGKLHTGRDALVAYIKVLPGGEMPWCHVVKFLIQAGRIGHVAREIRRRTGLSPPAGIANAQSMSKYIALASMDLYDGGHIPRLIAIATYYENEMIDRKIGQADYACRSQFLRENVKELLVEAVRSRAYNSATLDICGVYYLCMIPKPNYTEYRTTILDQVRAHGGQCSYDLIQEDDEDGAFALTEDEYNSFLENRDAPFQSIIDFYQSRFPSLNWNIPFHEFQLNIVNYWTQAIYRDDALDSLKIHICLTNIAESILAVRSLAPQVDNDHQDWPFEGDALNPDASFFALLRPVPGLPMSATFDNVHLGVVAPAQIDEEKVFDINKVILPVHSVYRPYGLGTSSMNKVAYVLDAHQALIIRGDDDYEDKTGLRIACLGEGYGGILGMLAEMCSDSYFIFNTLPDSEQEACYPEIARDAIERGGHEVSTALVNANVCNLTDPNVLEQISLEIGVTDLTTCDAECNWEEDLMLYERMIVNVCQFYLTTRRPQKNRRKDRGGVLIMKLFLDAGRVPYVAISLLCHFCGYVNVIRCPGSPPGSEVYVVACGFRRPFTDPIGYTTMDVLPVVARRLTALKARLREGYTLISNTYDNVMSLNTVGHLFGRFFSRLHPYIHEFPPIILQQLSARVGVPPAKDSLDKVDSLFKGASFVISALKNVEKLCSERLLRGCDDISTAWSGDTHHAQIHEALEVIQMKSLIKLSPVVLNQRMDTVYTSSLQDIFVDIMDSIPNRVFGSDQRSYLQYDSGVYNKGFTIDGIPFPAYEMFMESLGWLCSFRSWIITHMALP